ncbi:hypothetical protein [Pedobacter sp. L105]|uniref:hypothetical protein n=1 Tax=Pedobacter sp. L105 TaxID=1641871 RepID=UPI00131A79D3|nr:hypothetical protein [Pedobacter sp. L105]
MEQIKETLGNILLSIEDAGIFNSENLGLVQTADRDYEAVVIELKKTDGSKFGNLPDAAEKFEESAEEARTSQTNVDKYHAYRAAVVRKIENAINLL